MHQLFTKHKVVTAQYGMVASPSEGWIFARGLEYVMMSRPTKLEDVFLLNELKAEHFNAWIWTITLINISRV